jgi:hypothetical protein
MNGSGGDLSTPRPAPLVRNGVTSRIGGAPNMHRYSRLNWRCFPLTKKPQHIGCGFLDDYGKRNPIAHPKAASAALNVALGRITALHLAGSTR